MKKAALFAMITPVLIFSCLLTGSSEGRADSAKTLIRMKSGPKPQIFCDFKILTNQQDDLTGMGYACTGDGAKEFGVDQPTLFSLGQMSKGVVFMRKFGMTIISLSAPEISAREGGIMKIRYLKNAATQSYGEFFADIQKIGKRWIAYTTPDAGRQAFHEMSVTTYFLGVDKIEIE
ncbi:MAG: hypothetical protein A2428_09660 [Bdellovibrionales bacterium RIFOXYC1_FULL_54_43]|nr:MAG: hypothetical protein A2428_09660 [Bdellovibrionales bacterium RIFOXYC1_FULL_54_43]OFZ84684.1 MAG: hypothetical protein A2603_13770 [Bdellovibrionales bacterium RIFOXYD1_FULL_55_31]